MQLKYSDPIVYGCEGELSDSSFNNVLSRLNTGETPIPAGHLCGYGSEKDGCKVVSSKEDLANGALGISLCDRRPHPFAKGDSVSVLRQGRVFVCLESDVKSAGDPVYVTPAKATVGGKKETGTLQLKGACFMSPGEAGDVIEMEINLLGGAQ